MLTSEYTQGLKEMMKARKMKIPQGLLDKDEQHFLIELFSVEDEETRKYNKMKTLGLSVSVAAILILVMPYLEEESQLSKANVVSIDFFKYFTIHWLVYQMLDWNSENSCFAKFLGLMRFINLVYGAYNVVPLYFRGVYRLIAIFWSNWSKYD